jgi:hypothetical protein
MAATNAALSIDVFLAGGMPPAGAADRFNVDATNPSLEATRLSELFAAMASGVRPGKVKVRTDSVTGVQASLTMACTGTNIAAAEYLDVQVPNVRAYRLTAVASGAASGDGTFNTSATAATVATNIANAINSLPGLKDYVTASTNSANLILTAKEYGTVGNSYSVIDGTVNGLSPAGGSFASGKDSTSAVTATAALTHANIAADDTITIAGCVFTWKASASTESEVTIGANVTADGDNLVAKVNAHSKLLGLVTASNNAGTVTVTYLVPPRIAVLMLLDTSDGNSATLTQPSSTTTITNVTATRTYALGGA